MWLTLDRKEYRDKETLGELYVNGIWECLVLEDSLAVNGKKVSGETCIPDGVYHVLITPSPKFKRDLPLICDVPGFDGIRIHPGNTVDDTEGCLLVGENFTTVEGRCFLRNSRNAFDRLFRKMFEAKRDGQNIILEVAP